MLGVDVARFGDDEQIICPRKGRDARTLAWGMFRNLDTMQFAARVIERRNETRADAVFVDGGGVGGGAYLEINHQSATFVWLGCVIAFFCA